MENLDGRGKDRLRFTEPREIRPEQLAILFRTVLEDELLQLAEVPFEAVIGDQLELSHLVNLLQRMEEIVRDGNGRRGPAVLRGDPGLDLDGRELRRISQKQLDGINDHERGDPVGEVPLQLEKGLAQLR